MVNKRRSEFDIINNILTLAEDGVSKTKILYQCNLNHALVQKYLTFLIDKEAVEKKEFRNNGVSHTIYKTTKKGKKFLNDINTTLAHFGA